MVIGATCPARTAAFAMVPYADAEGACGWRSARIAVVKAVSTADVWLESEAIADWMPVCVPDAAGMNANALRAARAGGRALRAGDAPGAVPLLREALAAWRGPALADVAGEEFAAAPAARL